MWTACFFISVAVLICGIVLAVGDAGLKRSRRILSPFHIIFLAVFLAIATGLAPIYIPLFTEESKSILEVLIFDILKTLQVFTLNEGGEIIVEYINELTISVGKVYSTYLTVLFIIAPILTAGFILSLFKNVISICRYFIHFRKDIFAFSELNDKTIALASDLRVNHPDSMLIFSVVNHGEEIEEELLNQAEDLSAIIFQRELLSINFHTHSKKSTVSLLIMGEKESDNLSQTLRMIEKYKGRENTNIYVSSTHSEGEMLLANADPGKIRLRRINTVRSLVYQYLYEEGAEIFENACRSESTPAQEGVREIHALIVGMGQHGYGTEMTKALVWYGQMIGYQMHIHCVDQDDRMDGRFRALCPELMKMSSDAGIISEEKPYSIHLHSGVDASSDTFADLIASLPHITYVFVALGNDEENISHAANIRMLCERKKNCRPVIKTVVYNTEEKNALEHIKNYRGQEYLIDCIGDFESVYSEKTILGSALEQEALRLHMRWGDEEEFWRYEYNYRSSMASAIHMKAKILCEIPGAGKKEDELSTKERETLERIEHLRWNAYMRAEGYIWSGSTDKSTRNDLAKMHHDLVPYEALSEEEKRKDSRVSTK